MSWPLIISIGSLVFCFSAFIYFRIYIKRRTSFEGILKDVREEVNRLLRRIDEITENDISLIEDREKALRTLLEETDRRLAILNRELERRESAEKAYRDMGKNPIPIRLASSPVPSPAPEAAPAPQKPRPEGTLSLNEQIHELARSGFSPSVIASRLGISITEAELAVALQERRQG